MPSGEYQAAFGDGEHIFRLRIGELEELQEKCDAGPEFILQRIYSGAWLVADIRETIRLGLIGGGMPPTQALALRNRYCGEGALFTHKALASAILAAALMGSEGDEDEPPGEMKGETSPSPEDDGGSPASTKPAGSSGSTRKRLRRRTSGG
ncbi:gene transfer agent family protein [Brevundimonas sp. 2R-24]|uniref:Gene transfer agent family protein n=1 Tax=Peiella sedimenti TaxID=3061083 RepID=A0ABT8SRT2_9CAUL|nr:gene transfer agent family protein [Caulobacteraceae bacterium XZ-24]